jgi:hypothetical protein
MFCGLKSCQIINVALVIYYYFMLRKFQISVNHMYRQEALKVLSNGTGGGGVSDRHLKKLYISADFLKLFTGP